MIAVFYALVLKTPPIVAPSLNLYVAPRGGSFVELSVGELLKPSASRR